MQTEYRQMPILDSAGMSALTESIASGSLPSNASKESGDATGGSTRDTSNAPQTIGAASRQRQSDKAAAATDGGKASAKTGAPASAPGVGADKGQPAAPAAVGAKPDAKAPAPAAAVAKAAVKPADAGPAVEGEQPPAPAAAQAQANIEWSRHKSVLDEREALQAKYAQLESDHKLALQHARVFGQPQQNQQAQPEPQDDTESLLAEVFPDADLRSELHPEIAKQFANQERRLRAFEQSQHKATQQATQAKYTAEYQGKVDGAVSKFPDVPKDILIMALWRDHDADLMAVAERYENEHNAGLRKKWGTAGSAQNTAATAAQTGTHRLQPMPPPSITPRGVQSASAGAGKDQKGWNRQGNIAAVTDALRRAAG